MSSIYDYWKKYWRQIILAITLIMFVIPPLAPELFAVSNVGIQKSTRDAFAVIDALQPGDVVFVSNELSGHVWAVHNAANKDILEHMFRKPGVKIVFFAFQNKYEANALLTQWVLPVVPKFDKVYGEDYVVLPWMTGTISTLSAFVDEIRSVISVDAYGTPIDDIPMMADITSGADADLLFCNGTGLGLIDVWWARFNDLDIIWAYAVRAASQAAPYLRTGQYDGGVWDVKGAAEYEILMNEAGYGFGSGIGLVFAGMMDMFTYWMLLLLVIGNIEWLYQRSTSRR